MKKLTYLLFLFIFANEVSIFAKSGKTETIVIKTVIYCDHCKECESCGGKLLKDLSFKKGVKLVTLDVDAMTITVKYNASKTNADEIRKAVSLYGYDADDIKGDSASVLKLDGCCLKK